VRREDARELRGEDALRSGEAPPQSPQPLVTNGGNGSAGNGHRVDLDPCARVGRRWMAGAFGRRNGAPARALAEKLAGIAEHETNPWVLIKLAEVLPDTLDRKVRPAEPEVKNPRRLARIILTNGHAPIPSAKAAELAEPPRGEHYEGGQRFVSVSPSE
jgi:hypothetical protein